MAVRYSAAAALPYAHRDRAVAGLRRQLRLMALAAGATPDWTTLDVVGPREAIGLHGRSWFEWSASVEVAGGDELVDSVIDGLVPAPRTAAPPDVTAPLAVPLR